MKVENNLNIRTAQSYDLNSVFQLELNLFQPENYPYFFIRQAFDAMPETFLVAEIKDRLAGYTLGTLQAGREEAWILSLAVSKERRRIGIGTRLIDKLLNSFKEKGAKSAMLHVAPTNRTAINLYSKKGFIEVQREADYFGKNQERLIMKVELW